MTELSRITCYAHQKIGPRISKVMKKGNCSCIIREGARSISRLVRRLPFGLLGDISRLVDSPAEIYRCTVPRDSARLVVDELVRVGEFQLPGHGTVFFQDIQEHLFNLDKAEVETPESPDQNSSLVSDLSLITAILSVPGTEERLARTALELGTGVPIISSGAGTGIRDRLGLLRITIPPEKFLVHLIVPSRDAYSIMRLLIEEARLNSPGKGMIFTTPVPAGLMDTRLRIGRQEHAATIEQIIAAVDHLTAGTAWRTRFAAAYTEDPDYAVRPIGGFREITVLCRENHTRPLVDRAIDLGAGGATTTRVQRLDSSIEGGGVETADRARVIINTPAERAEPVVQAMTALISEGKATADSIQILEIPAVYSYR